MTERVKRIRGGGLDENNDPKPEPPAAPLDARAVEPGAPKWYTGVGRHGNAVEHTVYFVPAVDLVDGDELEVRGNRYDVLVQDWRSPRTKRTGTVAFCSRGQG